MKDFQATREASIHQKRTSSSIKHKISNFSIFVGHFYALVNPDPHPECGSGSRWPKSMQIWIQNTASFKTVQKT